MVQAPKPAERFDCNNMIIHNTMLTIMSTTANTNTAVLTLFTATVPAPSATSATTFAVSVSIFILMLLSILFEYTFTILTQIIVTSNKNIILLFFVLL